LLTALRLSLLIKISKLRLSLAALSTTASPHLPPQSVTPPDLSTYRPASEFEISKILLNCPNKQSYPDPIPTWLLKNVLHVLVSIITNIVNLTLSSGQFYPVLKQSTISPLLKMSSLDKDYLSNYSPISVLSLTSKIIERVVKSPLTDHFSCNIYIFIHQKMIATKLIGKNKKNKKLDSEHNIIIF